jgi:protein-L-isoaspartate(D-aspartate) O-methyltransferase
VHHGDGTRGWREHDPYDAIVVTAGAPDAPESLKNQLAIGGRLVIPTGPARAQELARIRRTGEDEYDQEEHSFMDWIFTVSTAPSKPFSNIWMPSIR